MPNVNKPWGEQEVFSFSKLSCFEQCKYQFKQKYRTKKDERPKERENAFSQYGVFVHDLLAHYETGEIAAEDLAPKFEEEFDVWVGESFPPSPNPNINLSELYYNSAYDFLSNYKGQSSQYTVLGVEKQFALKFDDIWFQGIIDLILQDKKDGGIIVHDWKSKSAIKTKADKRKYGRQLYLYSTYIKEAYGVWPKQLRLYLFRKNTPVDIPFAKEDYEEAVGWMKSQVAAISANTDWDSYTYDNFFCNYLCGFRDTCKWKGIEELGR